MESNLVTHARRELTRLGEEPEVIEGYLKVVQAFADMGHSGASAQYALLVLGDLLAFKNLCPLTNDPAEWMDVAEMSGKTMWQNLRNSECFSYDGGNSYWMLSDGSHMDHQVVMYEAEKV